MKKIVITNLRIPEDDWLQIKTLAVEAGISVNECINLLIRDLTVRRQLLIDVKKKISSSKRDAPIWRLGDLAKKFKSAKKYELSEDDKLIYE
ncbi:hypothetical protein HYT18_00475 [Candidatus Microgenomates bacterium]|nr:hypothetical protein [Candidatus Microgenomates bacterium]